MATAPKKSKALAGLARKTTKTKKALPKAKAKKTAKKAPADKRTRISRVAMGYTVTELRKWRKTWKKAKGCPACVRVGVASDGYFGVAIYHQDDEGTLCSHICFWERADRDAYVEALAFVYAKGKN